MTKEEYQEFSLRYKGCGASFPLYEKLNRFEKMWFAAIQKDVTNLEKENAELKVDYKVLSCSVDDFEKLQDELEEVTARLEKQKEINKELVDLQEETIKTFTQTIEEVKCLINDLLDNSDEYARQRARDYLERG